MSTSVPIAIAPDPARNSWLGDAVRSGGGEVVDVADARGLVWAIPTHPERLATLLADHPNIEWVQLPFAGIESFVSMCADGRRWTCGKGVYAEPVAELAMAMLLAGMRGVGTYARRQTWEKSDANELGRNLIGARVTILGGGGITTSLVRMLAGFEATTTVVRRRRDLAFPGAARTIELGELSSVLAQTDALILALALTDSTRGVVDADAMRRLPDHAWIVNVARGPHVVTDDLVAALRDGTIGGAALDVTDPEPLPDDHPLWTLPNVIITPHVGNTPAMAVPLLGARVSENVRRFAAGEALIGPVDPAVGY